MERSLPNNRLQRTVRCAARSLAGTLGDSSTLPGRLKNEFHADSKVSQHVDERFDAEEIEPTSNEVTDAGLGDAKETRYFRLCQSTGRDSLLDADHEVRADSEMLGLV